MSSLRGPRRTRIYNANYNIGENLYRPTLDKLDGKHQPRTSFADRLSTARHVGFNVDDALNDDLEKARSRASRAITEESVFDSRGARFPRHQMAAAFDDDVDEEVNASLNRIRASKMKTAAMINDFDAENGFDLPKRRPRLDLRDKFDDFGDDMAVGNASRRMVKISTRTEEVEPVATVSHKWTKISSSSEQQSDSAASMRAQASKARLHDIESDMMERSEKQFAREQRAANLKKILADNDIEAVVSRKAIEF